MALSEDKLQQDLKKFFQEASESGNDFSATDCDKEILDIYADYASSAQDPSGDRPLTTNKTTAEPIILSAFKAQKVEEGLISSLSTFWTGATFGISMPATGMSQETASVVTTFSIKPLKGIFTDSYEDYDEASERLAQKLHTFTKTVTVLITGLAVTGSPPPVITLSGTIS